MSHLGRWMRVATLPIAFHLPFIAFAAAPPAATETPGFYRMTLGAFEVTALSDGVLALPMDSLLTHTTAEKVRSELKGRFEKVPLPTSFNAYLVNTGRALILVDTGAGALFGPSLGKMLSNLKASGYQPEQIDEIYITHMHPDHVGGLSANGARMFPNAIIRIAKEDLDYWLSDANLAAAPKDDKSFFEGARVSLKPYVDAGAVKPFSDDTQLAEGIRSHATHGHTVGHSSYVVESDGQRLVILGDLIHVGAVQFAHPKVTIHFDSDENAAARARDLAFRQASAQGDWVAGAHLNFPGIGHIRAHGSSFEWFPAPPMVAKP